MDKNQSVSLGCGTLILIALIVLIFGGRSDRDVRELQQEVLELTGLVQQQTEAMKQLEKSLAETKQTRQP